MLRDVGADPDDVFERRPIGNLLVIEIAVAILTVQVVINRLAEIDYSVWSLRETRTP